MSNWYSAESTVTGWNPKSPLAKHLKPKKFLGGEDYVWGE